MAQINPFSLRIPNTTRVVRGGRTSNFYLGGSMVLNHAVLANNHATATGQVEIVDRKNINNAFYYNVPSMGTVIEASPYFFNKGFKVITGASIKASITYTSAGNERGF